MKANNYRFLWLNYVAILIIVIAFFVISYCGFFIGDDIWMNHGVSTLSDVFEHTKMFYLTYGGRLFSIASQYLFSGVLGNNRIWFDVVNTLFFVLLIMSCGKLIDNGKKPYSYYVLVFALLFWFFCPKPAQTLFWVAGSTTYLWANALAFMFLFFFQKYKDDSFSVVGKLGLFIMSFFAATEFITCASICGAFVVYYASHIKKFKGNVVPFVVGFALGSIVLLSAPGNFARAATGLGLAHSIFDIQYLLHHPLQEIIKYKILWIFFVVFVWGWITNNKVVKVWVKKNSILLLSLGWSVFAFTVVFMPLDHAIFFPETLSLVLLLGFLFDNYTILKIRFIDGLVRHNLSFIRTILLISLFVIFTVDSVFAIVETKKQRKNYDVLLNEVVNSEGIVVSDREGSSHRMAIVSVLTPWEREVLAEKYDLDSVYVYPYYCQDKYYKLAPPLDNIYIDDINYKNDDDVFGKYIRLIVRIKNEELQASNDHVTFVIDYTRPRKWYKSWLDKWSNYRYDRTDVVERDNPDICFDGYSYYIIYFGRDNVKGLKSVKYTIE